MKFKVIENDNEKTVRSEKYNYNFNKKTGFFARWGKTENDDPLYAPMPEILDIEVTTKCNGINGVVCPFCLLPSTPITLDDGTTKKIEDIKVGDKVQSYDENSKTDIINTVKEVYEREFKDELIVIVLADNTELKITPNHRVFTYNRGWVRADELDINDNVRALNEEM